MIAIIDYGMGNLRSVQKGFERVGFEAVVTADPKKVLEADKIVLPGVGAFPDCMRNLEQGGFVEPIRRVIKEGRPFLGICLGLQLLFTESEEFGLHKGLDVIPGRVVRFPEEMKEGGEELKVPHMGWNRVSQTAAHPLWSEIEDGSRFYFVHSYFPQADEALVRGTTEYGIPFTCAVARDNIFAVQFHPEKSDTAGLRHRRRLDRAQIPRPAARAQWRNARCASRGSCWHRRSLCSGTRGRPEAKVGWLHCLVPSLFLLGCDSFIGATA